MTTSTVLAPQPAQPVASSIPKSLTYCNKQLALYARIKNRIKALKYHYDHIQLADDALYHETTQKLASYITLLEYNNFICNKAYLDALRGFNKMPETTRDHVTEIFGRIIKKTNRIDSLLQENARNVRFAKKYNKKAINQYLTEKEDLETKKKLINEFKSKLRLDCLNARQLELKKRLTYAILEAKKENWYLVFGTLSVDDHNYSKVFNEESSAWTDYIRSVDRAVGISLCGNWRNAIEQRNSGNDFHKYFAVVEQGGKTGRLHIHVIHMMKKLPLDAKDPNNGMTQPIKQNIECFRKYWPHGYVSLWKAMRTSNSDAFGQANWRWPVQQEIKDGDINYKPLPIGGIMRVVNYVGKYITKNYLNQKQGELKWRTKMSRKLGLKPMEKLAEKLTVTQLYNLLKIKPTIKLFNKTIPTGILKRVVFKKWLNQKSMTKNTIRRLMALKNLESKENVLKRFENSILPLPTSSPLKCGDITMTTISKTDAFNYQEIMDKISIELYGENPTQNPPAAVGGSTMGAYYG
nr:MAG: replication initiator protein [Microvirus sp.]